MRQASWLSNLFKKKDQANGGRSYCCCRRSQFSQERRLDGQHNSCCSRMLFALRQYYCRSCWLDYALITLIVGLVWGFDLFGHPLSVPDSARYAEIPREMLEKGDWVTPYLNGVKYFEKPPLFYWLQLLAFKIGGVSADLAMVPNFLISLASVLSTYFLGSAIFGRLAGLASALALASSLAAFAFTRFLTLDVILSLTLTVAIGCFWLAQLPADQGRHKVSVKSRSFGRDECNDDRDRDNIDVGDSVNGAGRGYLWMAYLAAAAAVMSKGLVGMLLPALVLGSWFLLAQDWQALKKWLYWPAILLAMLLVAPWHIIVQYRNPEFWHFYFFEQHFARFFTDYAMREQAWWFFVPVMLIGWYPWTAILPSIARLLSRRFWYRWEHFKLSKWDRAAKSELFILLWATCIVLFFSFSRSKLIPYVLPAFPPMALLVGRYLAEMWQHTLDRYSPAIGWMRMNVVLAIGGAIAAVWAAEAITARIDHGATLLWQLTAVWAVSALAIWLLKRWRRTFGQAVLVMAVSMAAIFQIISGHLYNINCHSIYPLVKVLQAQATEYDTVIAYHDYYQELPFYLRRKVVVVGDRGELTFGAQHQADAAQWMWTQSRFNRCMMLANDCHQRCHAGACRRLTAQEDGCFLRRYPYLSMAAGQSGALSKFELDEAKRLGGVGYYYILTKWSFWEQMKFYLPMMAEWRFLARDRDIILITNKPPANKVSADSGGDMDVDNSSVDSNGIGGNGVGYGLQPNSRR